MSSAAPSRVARSWSFRPLDAPAIARARLAIVPRARARAPKVPFVTLVSLILLAGVVGLLCFNTSMQQAAFTATALDQRAAALAAREQTLQMELQELRNPQHIAERAQAQGMVIPVSTGWLDVATGRVEGEPAPATAENTPPLHQRIRKPAPPAPVALPVDPAAVPAPVQ